MTDTHILSYGNCDCYVWPLVGYQPIGRCGRCNARPEPPYFKTRDDALTLFRSQHGRDPLPIGGKH